MFQKVIRALSKHKREALAPKPKTEELPDGNAVFRKGLAVALGPEAAKELLAELDYNDRVAYLERLAALRRRERAVQSELETLR
jgi:hypothetical protein